MEVLGILFWFVVLGADIAFMTKIPRVCRDFEHWLDTKKRPSRAGTRTRGRHKMTKVVYDFEGRMSRENG